MGAAELCRQHQLDLQGCAALRDVAGKLVNRESADQHPDGLCSGQTEQNKSREQNKWQEHTANTRW